MTKTSRIFWHYRYFDVSRMSNSCQIDYRFTLKMQIFYQKFQTSLNNPTTFKTFEAWMGYACNSQHRYNYKHSNKRRKERQKYVWEYLSGEVGRVGSTKREGGVVLRGRQAHLVRFVHTVLLVSHPWLVTHHSSLVRRWRGWNVLRQRHLSSSSSSSPSVVLVVLVRTILLTVAQHRAWSLSRVLSIQWRAKENSMSIQ